MLALITIELKVNIECRARCKAASCNCALKNALELHGKQNVELIVEQCDGVRETKKNENPKNIGEEYKCKTWNN